MAVPFCCYTQVSKLLHYSPVTRVTALGALTHPFFDELRDPNTTLPNGMSKFGDLISRGLHFIWKEHAHPVAIDLHAYHSQASFGICLAQQL